MKAPEIIYWSQYLEEAYLNDSDDCNRNQYIRKDIADKEKEDLKKLCRGQSLLNQDLTKEKEELIEFARILLTNMVASEQFSKSYLDNERLNLENLLK